MRSKAASTEACPPACRPSYQRLPSSKARISGAPCDEIVEEAHRVGMVGDDQPVERAGELDRLAGDWRSPPRRGRSGRPPRARAARRTARRRPTARCADACRPRAAGSGSAAARRASTPPPGRRATASPPDRPATASAPSPRRRLPLRQPTAPEMAKVVVSSEPPDSSGRRVPDGCGVSPLLDRGRRAFRDLDAEDLRIESRPAGVGISSMRSEAQRGADDRAMHGHVPLEVPVVIVLR